MKYAIVKRILDLIFAIVLSLLLLPIIVLISIVVWAESKGPVLFRQKRVGKDGALFDIYKYRTMVADAPKNVPTRKLTGKNYITRSGRFLRRTGLDELPQLINILRGEMSFVGPRPVIPDEEDLLYLRRKYGVDECVPGITGWAQANGRDEIDVEEKAYMDGVYAKNFGVKMDWRCVIKTIGILSTGKGHKEGFSGDIDMKKIKLRPMTKLKQKAKNFNTK